MSSQSCFICASNEGIFLDIAKDNGKKLRRQLETCLSVKVTGNAAFTTKVCHKCGFELEQCESFVQKFRKNIKLHKRALTSRCFVCRESVRSSYAFNLYNDLSVNNPLCKIQDFLQEKPTNVILDGDLICLSCRYSVDILHDLKNIYKKTSGLLQSNTQTDLNNPTVPKIDTIAVSRKTTITKADSIKLSTLDDLRTDSDTMARGQSRVSKVKSKKASAKSKKRVCDDCHNTVENDSDMFRFHRTGSTVCKTCWTNVDPSQHSSRKRARTEHSGGGSVETKLCAVFLKDVLKESTSKDEKIYKTERDSEGNIIYVITDDSSESDTKSTKSFADSKGSKEDKIVKRVNVKKAENAVKTNNRGTKRTTRATKTDSIGSEQSLTALNKPIEEPSKISQQPVSTSAMARRKRKETENTADVLQKQAREPEGRQTRKKLRTLMEGISTEQASSISSESSPQDSSGARIKRKTRSDNLSGDKTAAAVSQTSNINTSETTEILDDESDQPTTAGPPTKKSDDKVDRKSHSPDETRTKRKTRSDNLSGDKTAAAVTQTPNINTSETTEILDDDSDQPTTAGPPTKKSDDKVDRKSYSADETKTKRKTRSDNLSGDKTAAAITQTPNINTSETTVILDDESAQPTTAGPLTKKSDDKVDRKSYSADETTQAFKSPVQKERRRSSLSLTVPKSVTFETESDSVVKEKKLEEPEKHGEEHSCNECGVMQENKLALMTHLLTHFKQPELKLSKVISSAVAEDRETTVQATESEVENLNEEERQSEEIRITIDDEEDVPDKTATEDNLSEKHEDSPSKDTTENDASKKDIGEKETDDKEATDKDIPSKEVIKENTSENITAGEDTVKEVASENDISEEKNTKSDEEGKDNTEKDASEKVSDASISEKCIPREVAQDDQQSDSIFESKNQTENSAETAMEKETTSNNTDAQELDDENEEDMILKTTPDETSKETLENNEDTKSNKLSENKENEKVDLLNAVTEVEPKETSRVHEIEQSENPKVGQDGADRNNDEENSIGINNIRRSSTDSHKSTKDDDIKDNAEEETDIEQLKISDTEANENVTELEDSPVIIQNNVLKNKQSGEDNERANDSPRKKKNSSPKASRKGRKSHAAIEEKGVESETDVKTVDTVIPDTIIERDVISENKVVLDDKANEDDVGVSVVNDDKNTGDVTVIAEKNDDVQVGADKENDKDFAVAAINEGSKSQSGSPRKKVQEDSTTAATEVLQEVFQLATNESQKDQETIEIDSSKDDDHKQAASNDVASHEIRTSADMPSLDSISADVGESNDVLLV